MKTTVVLFPVLSRVPPIAGHLALFCASLLVLFFAPSARAQLVADGTTATINATTTNLTGSLTIGTNGSFTTLIITNAGAVTNVSDGLGPSDGRIGLDASSLSNQVILTGAGSFWRSAQELYVGYSGSYNLLLVTNGGRMHNNGGHVGISSAHNLALITGPGSVWTNVNSLQVGGNASFNQMIVTNGGRVYADDSHLGGNASSRSNLVMVTGPGSLFTNSLGTSGLHIGYPGSFNQLLVTNGGTVANNGGYLGGSVGSSNNLVVVTGNNSLWTNRFNLYAGEFGSFNHLVVVEGGTVVNGIGYVGYGANSSNNFAVVSGSNSLWASRSDLHVGSFGSLNFLSVTNAGTITASNLYVGFDPSSSNNAVRLDGGSIFITNSSGTRITDVRRGTLALNYGLLRTDRLLLTNGTQGQLAFYGGTLITRGGTISNSLPLIVGGGGVAAVLDVRAGQPLALYDRFFLGSNAPNNRLYITNGGTLQALSASSSILGNEISGSNNLALISGAGSFWTNNNDLIVGETGAFNSLVISNGGVVASDAGILGANSTGSNNTAVVSGAGSYWTNTDLNVGGSGSFNQLVVTNGGVVNVVRGSIGQLSGNNIALVTSPNSLWSSSTYLYVGAGGTFNRLVVSNGAVVRDDIGLIGNAPGTSGNAAVVTDPGSMWTNHSDLSVGNNNSVFNQLIITNGGTVQNNRGYIGKTSGNNMALVTGSNSLWTSTSNLYVGDASFGNQLLVTNRGLVRAHDGIIGLTANTGNNRALITDSGSQWINQGTLYVGYGGQNNTLLVTNGGTLIDQNGVVGNGGNSTGNKALVTGPGSLWTNAGSITIGASGNANEFVVTNGAVVRAGNGIVGVDATADDNLAVITGSGSLWAVQGPLTVGDDGAFNELDVNNAGTVLASNLTVGRGSASSLNTVAVSGGNLIVTNASGNSITDIRRGTLALDGGLVLTDHLLLTNGSQSTIDFNGGTLQTRNTTCSNGALFVVGNGSSSFSSIFELVGNGIHRFVNGLQIDLKALLKGNGTIIGDVTVFRGTLSPGTSIGQIAISGSLSLLGGKCTNIFELDKGTGTNDNIKGLTSVAYGGRLVVTNLSGTLAAGDSFKLFDAASYSGAFLELSPAIPGPGLRWNTNGLVIDGTLRVAALTNPPPSLGGLTLSSRTNLLLSASGGVPYDPVYLQTATNLAPPFTNWVYLVTNSFDANGNASFTNTVAPAEPQRFFRLQVQ